MPRVLRQALPQPPPNYDQTYIAQLANAINRYIFQREAPGEIIAARFICLDPVQVGVQVADTSQLPTGTIYLKQVPGSPPGTLFLTVVLPQDQ